MRFLKGFLPFLVVSACSAHALATSRELDGSTCLTCPSSFITTPSCSPIVVNSCSGSTTSVQVNQCLKTGEELEFLAIEYTVGGNKKCTVRYKDLLFGAAATSALTVDCDSKLTFYSFDGDQCVKDPLAISGPCSNSYAPGQKKKVCATEYTVNCSSLCCTSPRKWDPDANGGAGACVYPTCDNPFSCGGAPTYCGTGPPGSLCVCFRQTGTSVNSCLDVTQLAGCREACNTNADCGEGNVCVSSCCGNTCVPGFGSASTTCIGSRRRDAEKQSLRNYFDEPEASPYLNTSPYLGP